MTNQYKYARVHQEHVFEIPGGGLVMLLYEPEHPWPWRIKPLHGYHYIGGDHCIGRFRTKDEALNVIGKLVQSKLQTCDAIAALLYTPDPELLP